MHDVRHYHPKSRVSLQVLRKKFWFYIYLGVKKRDIEIVYAARRQRNKPDSMGTCFYRLSEKVFYSQLVVNLHSGRLSHGHNKSHNKSIIKKLFYGLPTHTRLGLWKLVNTRKLLGSAFSAGKLYSKWNLSSSCIIYYILGLKWTVFLHALIACFFKKRNPEKPYFENRIILKSSPKGGHGHHFKPDINILQHTNFAYQMTQLAI